MVCKECRSTEWEGPADARSCSVCGNPDGPREPRFLFVSNVEPSPLILKQTEGLKLIWVQEHNLIPGGKLVDVQAELERLDTEHHLEGVLIDPGNPDLLITVAAREMSLWVGIIKEGELVIYK